MGNPRLFRIFDGADGYRPNDTTDDFLGRANYAPIPYYLLIVGDPEDNPF